MRKSLLTAALAGSLIVSEPAVNFLYDTSGTSYSAGIAYASEKKKPKASPSPLKGTTSSMREQNLVADKENLSRIEDDEMLRRFVATGYLVPLRGNSNYNVDERLATDRAYARPWTRQFVERLSSQYMQNFGEPLTVTSAVRTVEYQRRLDETNSNAASPTGPKASSHLTGATVDITKRGLHKRGVKWLRATLSDLDKKGLIEATEEFKQPVFHVMVYRDYRTYQESRPAKKGPKKGKR